MRKTSMRLLWWDLSQRGKVANPKFPQELNKLIPCSFSSVQFDGTRVLEEGAAISLTDLSHVLFVFHETDSSPQQLMELVKFEFWLRQIAPELSILNPPSRARYLSDKLWQYATLQKAGITCPRYWSLNDPESLHRLEYPVLLRDPASYSGKRIARVDSVDEAERVCQADHRYRMAAEIVDTRIGGKHVRYRALLCGANLLRAFALVADQLVANGVTLVADSAAYHQADARLQRWLSEDRSGFWQQISSALGMHTLAVDFFLTANLDVYVFDIGLKIGEGATWPSICHAYHPGLKACSAQEYATALCRL